MIPDTNAPTRVDAPPAGSHLLLRRCFRWFAVPSLVLVASAAGFLSMIPQGNALAIPIIGCGIAGAIAALVAFAGLMSWIEARREINAMRQGEVLTHWNCPQKHWELMDPTWKPGEPLGDVWISPYAIYVGSPIRDVLFFEWRSRRQHLSLVEFHAGSPDLLRIDVWVPSSGRIPGYKTTIALPIPAEHRQSVEKAVAALQVSDAFHPKGESWNDILIAVAIGATFVAFILGKLGFFGK